MDETFLYETPGLIQFETHCLQLVKGQGGSGPEDDLDDSEDPDPIFP